MTLRDHRHAVLEGAAKAAEAHERLSLRSRLQDGNGPIDIFRAVKDMKVDFLFRPLDNLLGAFLPSPARGIIVTTQRDLYVQRFTAAHELGHFLLSHEVSLDDEGSIGFAARGLTHHDLQEVAADAFASEFLIPRWLVAAHVSRQGWTKRGLRTARVVYQLSLRLGVSYQAMCWALAGHKAIHPSEASKLAGIAPKRAKLEALRGDFLKDSRANVWTLTQRDGGMQMIGTPGDVIQVELPERASAGLSWNVETVSDLGFEILDDSRHTTGNIGSFGVRCFVIRGSGEGRLRLEERRHWDSVSSARTMFDLQYSLHGKESGFPRVCRETLH